MKRRALLLAFALSVAATLAVASAWLRTIWRCDQVNIRSARTETGTFRHTTLGVETGRRHLAFYISRGTLPANRAAAQGWTDGWRVRHFAQPAESTTGPTFGLWTIDELRRLHVRLAHVPMWLAVALPLALSLLFSRPLWLGGLRRRRAKRGLCLACGYDLRGTAHERCPECGADVRVRVAAV